MNHCHIAVFILLATGTCDEISMHQTNLVAGEHSEIFLGRFLHEIFSLNIKFFGERYLSCTQCFVLQVIVHSKHLNCFIIIVIDHQLDGIQYGHDTRTFCFQILTDTVLQHRILGGRVCLGHTTQIYKHTNGFGCKAPSSKSSDGNQSGIIPTVHNALFHQLFDISLSGDHISQIHFCKLNLLGRMRIFQLCYHPVVQWSVIFKFQSTDRMGDALNGILNGMSIVIHGIDAPLVAGILVRQMSHTINDGISHIHIGRSHINLCTQCFLSVCKLAVLHILKQLQVFFYGTISVGIVFTGLR